MENFTIILILSGILAGAVNFFVNYLELPFPKSNLKLFEDGWPKLKTLSVAILGYAIVGIAGSFLTPLINAILSSGLKGLEYVNGKPVNPFFEYILFGYGLVFGYSTTKLLLSVLDSIMKRVSRVEANLNNLNEVKENLHSNSIVTNRSAKNIIDECELNFDEHKSDCSGFVKAVANKFGVVLTGQANEIVDQIKNTNTWTILNKDGVKAKEKADLGWLVIGGLEANPNGHVVVIVSGTLAFNKYPTGYWGKLGTIGKKNATINYAWIPSERDNVIYSAIQV